ncbi:hypothetical protein V8C44DRAFT_221358 [Trichoderma aethiopicum]
MPYGTVSADGSESTEITQGTSTGPTTRAAKACRDPPIRSTCASAKLIVTGFLCRYARILRMAQRRRPGCLERQESALQGPRLALRIPCALQGQSRPRPGPRSGGQRKITHVPLDKEPSSVHYQIWSKAKSKLPFLFEAFSISRWLILRCPLASLGGGASRRDPYSTHSEAHLLLHSPSLHQNGIFYEVQPQLLSESWATRLVRYDASLNVNFVCLPHPHSSRLPFQGSPPSGRYGKATLFRYIGT